MSSTWTTITSLTETMAPFVAGVLRFWTSTASVLKQNPVAFNSITGGVLCGGSDVFAQCVERQQGTKTTQKNLQAQWIDIRRALVAGAIGGFFGGGVYPYAYGKLDAIWKGTNFSTVLQKSVVEIFTVGIFVNTVSMSSRGFLGGRKPKQVAEHVVREMPTVTLNDVRLWLPYNMVAFTFIPAYIRPSTTAFMEAAWQTYISLRANDYGATNHVTPSVPIAGTL